MTSAGQFATAVRPSTPAPPPPGAVDHAAAAPRPPGRVRRRLADTPGRMTAVSRASVIAAVAFALLGLFGVNTQGTELKNAVFHSEQLVRLQAIRTNLVQADAAATNAFLAGGLEDPALRALYVERVDAAARDLVGAAGQTYGRDVEQLAAINAKLSTYTGLVEAARANNRQRFPVGASYLRQASDLLRTEIQPVLIELSDDEANQVLRGFADATRGRILVLVALGVALVVLIPGAIWLARRVHRYLNVPLTAGTVAVVLISVVSLLAMGWTQSRADQVRERDFAVTLALAQARTLAFDAKTDESLRLIFQGSGAGDTRWKALDAEVVRQLDRAAEAGAAPLDGELARWRAVHTELRALDDGNDWRGAVALATGTGEGSSNEAFAAFDVASQRELDAAVQRTADTLPIPAEAMQTLSLGVLLAGVAVAFTVRRGYAQRLQEYR